MPPSPLASRNCSGERSAFGLEEVADDAKRLGAHTVQCRQFGTRDSREALIVLVSSCLERSGRRRTRALGKAVNQHHIAQFARHPANLQEADRWREHDNPVSARPARMLIVNSVRLASATHTSTPGEASTS